jgi:hypothetical protein
MRDQPATNEWADRASGDNMIEENTVDQLSRIVSRTWFFF